MINHVFIDKEQRTNAISLWSSFGGIAMAAGPLIGGIIISWLSWRSIFLINLLVGFVGVFLSWRFQFNEQKRTSDHFDFLGQVTIIIALAAFIAVLIEAPTIGWQSPLVLLGMTISLLMTIVFLFAEYKQRQPMLPLSFFCNRIFSAATFVSMVSGLIFYGLLFVINLYFQQSQAYSPLSAGMVLLPLTTFVAVGSMLSGRLIKRCGCYFSVLVLRQKSFFPSCLVSKTFLCFLFCETPANLRFFLIDSFVPRFSL